MEKELAFLRVIEQLRRFYRSSCGRTLTVADWNAFKNAVEAFDRAADGTVLAGVAWTPDTTPPARDPLPTEPTDIVDALMKPASVLSDRIHHPRKATLSMARNIVNRFSFVFQVVGADPRRLRGAGPGILSLIGGAAEEMGLSMGMDLSPYDSELDDVTLPPRQALTSDSEWDLFRHENTGQHEYHHYLFKFVSPGRFQDLMPFLWVTGGVDRA